MAESLIGKKVILKKAKNPKARNPNFEFLTESVSEVVFEGQLLSQAGWATFIGLKNRGELVLSGGNSLKLFLWTDDTGRPLHDFEEVNE